MSISSVASNVQNISAAQLRGSQPVPKKWRVIKIKTTAPPGWQRKLHLALQSIPAVRLSAVLLIRLPDVDSGMTRTVIRKG